MWSSNLDTSASFAGGFLDNSRKGGQDDVKLKRVQTVIPVMIGHLLSSSSTDEMKLWDIPARMFSFIALIRQTEETTTKISYEVEDQTGTITALRWLEAERKTSEPVMSTNMYVRIIGLLREQNEKRHILILRMWPLEDLNELTNHLLEVTYATLKAEAMAKKSNEQKGTTKDTTLNEGASDESPYYGLTADQTLVYKIIQAENHTESGIERSEIKTRVPQRILSKTDELLDFLVSEGHIYTTSTDDHFKTT